MSESKRASTASPKSWFPFPVSTTTEAKNNKHRATEEDKQMKRNASANYAFGELLPRAVTKVLKYLNVNKSTTLNDLGMGCAKLILQVSPYHSSL